ncbi:MAG: efflux RND transporter permease subunit [Elusimicrobia bacterium]|nr:efflux RND transporter permease subunit [Elusimicrobiota bacterium]
MIEFFLRRRVLTNLITFFVIGVGGWMCFTVRREAFPEIKFDIVTVNTPYPGASPEEVETLVTRKIEDQLRGVSGIDRIESFSLEDRSIIVMRLDDDLSQREKDRAVNDVYQAAARVEDLPEVADKPIVQELTSDRPLITVSVAGGGDEARDRYAEELKEVIEDIDGVSRVETQGDRAREIIVEADRSKLARARMTMGELAAAIRQRNVDRSAGAVSSGTLENWVRVRGAVSTAEEVGSVIVRGNDERGYLRVRDLAQVREGFADQRVMIRAGGRPAIDLWVRKHKVGDTIRLADAVKRLVAEQGPRAEALGINLVLSDDVSFFIRRRLKVMTSNMLQGGVLILIALFVFLDWRLATVAAWGVPISFAAAMLVAVPLGFTINLISLLAFIIVLGMLDDDSVVVAENIYRHLEAGEPPERAASLGAREVVLPVLGSVLVSSCAFLPFALMSGIMGKFLLMIPLVVCMCFLASLLEAFFILPAHVVDLVPFGRPIGGTREPGWYLRVVGGYRRAIHWVLAHRGKFAAGVALFVVGTVGLGVARLKFVLFPPGLVDQFFVQLEMPPGTNLEESRRVLEKVEQAVLELPPSELEAVTGAVGLRGIEETQRLGTHYAQARVFLTPAETRGRTTDAIIEELRAKLGLPQGARRLTFTELQPGPPVGEAIVVRARGRDPEVNRRIAEELKAELATMPGVTDIADSGDEGKRQWRVLLDPREAAFAGLTAARAAEDLFWAVDGIKASEIHRPDEDVDIRLRLRADQRSRKEELLALEVLNAQGRPVALNRVARIEEAAGPPVLTRYNFRPAVTVTADVDLKKTTSREANEAVRRKFADIPKRYPGYSLIFGGEEEETAKSMRSLLRAFGVAVLLDFVILAALFRSYIQPFIILLTIPIGLLGVAYALFVHGEPASFMALLGVVAMTGVVVNNAIVLVNFINEKRAKGLSAIEAASEAGADRLRPIWASSITTLLGLFPTAYGFGGFEPFVAPMALALAWGLTFAMPMTLFVIPAAYVLVDDWTATLKRWLSAGRGRPPASPPPPQRAAVAGR